MPLLAFFFLKKHAMAMGKEIADISPEAMRLLSDYAYPGNVRELANIIKRGVALAGGPLLELQHLPDTLKQICVKVLPQAGKRLPTLDEYEAEYIRHNWNTLAATVARTPTFWASTGFLYGARSSAWIPIHRGKTKPG